MHCFAQSSSRAGAGASCSTSSSCRSLPCLQPRPVRSSNLRVSCLHGEGLGRSSSEANSHGSVSRPSVDSPPPRLPLKAPRAAEALTSLSESQASVDCEEDNLHLQVSRSFPMPAQQDLQAIVPQLTPKQLADAIWGLARQKSKPADGLLEALASQVHAKMSSFKTQDLSNAVWALAVLRYQPSKPWWEDFERQVYNSLTDFSDRELANLMWALAILEHRPAMVLDSLLSHAADNFSSYSANSLHLLVWSVGRLGYQPSSEWLNSFLKASQGNFFQFTPSEMANIIWALAKLGHKLPTMWLDNFLMVAQWRFPSFGAKLLSIVVWSAAVLEHRPSQEWLLCFEQQVREKFPEFNGQELACIAWALRKFGFSTEHNTVFYMLERQDSFLEVDWEILANSKLLSQVLSWRKGYSAGSPGSL